MEAFSAAKKRRGVKCGPLRDRGWGILTAITLPGGGRLGVYQARHARPKAAPAGRGTRKDHRRL